MADDTARSRKMTRLYVPLDVEFPTDPKILQAGPMASYLFLCSLAYCKRQGDRGGRQGFVHAKQLNAIAPGLSGKVQRHVEALVDAGLWAPEEGGWNVAAWLKHNKSADELAEDRAKKQERAIYMNHKRHHVDKKEPSPDCALCYPDGPPGTERTNVLPRSAQPPKSKGEGSQRERESEGRVKSESEGESEGESSSSSPKLTLVAPDRPDDDDEGRTLAIYADLQLRTEQQRPDRAEPITHPTAWKRACATDARNEHGDAIRRHLANGYTPDELALWLITGTLAKAQGF